MKQLVPIPHESVERPKKEKKKEWRYQFVGVTLKDGRCFEPAIASEGYIIEVKGHMDIPFTAEDVQSVAVTHKHWEEMELTRENRWATLRASPVVHLSNKRSDAPCQKLTMPARKKPEIPHQFKVGESVSITLHTGRIVDGTVRAVIECTDGKRLQVDYGKDETALVELWRVRLDTGHSA